MSAVALVDVGKSGARLVLTDMAAVRTVQDAVQLSPADTGDQGKQLGERIVAMLESFENLQDLFAVVIGSTAELDPTESEALARVVHSMHPAAIVVSCDDGTLAHARLIGGSGVLLSIGTGVIAISLNDSGVLRRYDGWGPLIGDRGGAVDLGREALRLAYSQYDLRVGSALSDLATAEFGSPSALQARALTADPQWPVRLSEFGGKVAVLAEQDASAAELVKHAADLLAETARVAAADAGVVEIVVTGRFGVLPAVNRALRAAFASQGLMLVQREVLRDESGVVERILHGPYRAAMRVAPARKGR